MEHAAYEWHPHPPTRRQRILAGIWLALLLGIILNFFAEWQLFRGYDKSVFAGSVLASVFFVARMPKAVRAKGAKRPLRFWVVFGLVMTGAIALVFLWPKD
jgi:hypothetical protein